MVTAKATHTAAPPTMTSMFSDTVAGAPGKVEEGMGRVPRKVGGRHVDSPTASKHSPWIVIRGKGGSLMPVLCRGHRRSLNGAPRKTEI